MGKTYSTPEVKRAGCDNPDKVVVYANGFGGSEYDPYYLRQELIAQSERLQFASFSSQRVRCASLHSPKVEGKGAVQRRAAGLLDVMSLLARESSTNKMGIVGHSMGCPTAVEAYLMVRDGNLPPFLMERRQDLEDIFDQVTVDLVAPAGFIPVNRLSRLARAMMSGASSIVKDVGPSKEQLGPLLPRGIEAAKCLLIDPLLAVAEGLDASGLRTMEGVAAFLTESHEIQETDSQRVENIERLRVVTFEDDEIFPSASIVGALVDPASQIYDRAVLEVASMLDPLLPTKLILSGKAAALTPVNVGRFVAKAWSHYEQLQLDSDQELALKSLADRVIRLEGNHSTVLTKKGAKNIATVISQPSQAIKAVA